MQRATVFLAVAGFMYVVAWFLPVVDGGTTLAKGGLPGWEALRLALWPIWNRDAGIESWGALIGVLSGLTNGWFLASVLALTVWPVKSKRLLVWGSLLAALINAQWFALSDAADRADFRIGYYVWLASFAVLACAAHSKSKARVDSATP